MRRNILLTLSLAALTALMGCSARRAAGLASGPRNPLPSDGASLYDSDPPSRMAIQPPPVPPVRGISFIQQTSGTRVVTATASRHVEDSCGCQDAPVAQGACGLEPHCAAPEGCSDDCRPAKKSFLACLSDACHDHLRRLKAVCKKPRLLRRSDCGEQECASPACAAPACESPTCEAPCCEAPCFDEPVCGERRCRVCAPIFKKHNKLQPGCECPVAPGCAEATCRAPLGEGGVPQGGCGVPTEGCCECRPVRRGLLVCLAEVLMHNPVCRINPRAGRYCLHHSGCCAEEPCGSELCGESCGQAACLHGHCPPTSPLADCLTSDPFQQHDAEQPAPAEGNSGQPSGEPALRELTPEPEPAEPQPVDETGTQVPPVPSVSFQRPLSRMDGHSLAPVPTQSSAGHYVEPQIWPRLKVDATAQGAEPTRWVR